MAVAIALAAVLGTFASVARAQGDAVLTPPHADYGVDTDGDLQYNWLRVDVNLDATVAGAFYVVINLFDPTYTFIITGGSTMIVLSGPGTASVDLPGMDIRNSMVDGPYIAEISVFDDVFTQDDFGTHTTQAYLWTDFEQPGLSFTPPHADSVIDTDADMLFDFLRVTWNVDVFNAGMYDFSMDVFDGFGGYIGTASGTANLGTGPQSFDADFPGWRIRANGVDGPFDTSVNVYDSMGFFVGQDAHTTAAYTAASFEAPPLSFTPPHADSVIDTDADMLYDFLRVSWDVDVATADVFRFDVSLYDQFFTWIDSVNFQVSLSPGPQVVVTDFIGYLIRQNGVNGPFTAEAYAFDSMGNYVDFGAHVTAGYLWSDFEAPPLQFTPPHADSVLDMDGDVLFNVLEVNWSVDVSEAGMYSVSVDLYDSMFNWIDYVRVDVPLSAGPQVVTTDFPGWVIRLSGFDGPYTAMANAYNETGVFMDSDVHSTAPYTWNQFDTPPASLAPPHADAGVDTDLDGLFNQISIDVQILVDEPGVYEVQVLLFDLFGINLLGANFTQVPLSAGPQTVSLWFSTLPMQVQSIPGPYQAWIDLYTAGRNLGSDTHFTQLYMLAQFDPIPAAFAPPHWDQGVDRDLPPDGLYNVLEATVNVTVTDAGTFAVVGQLWDLGGTTALGQDVFVGPLGTGTQSVVLTFSGTAIRLAGIDGPYMLDLMLYAAGGMFPVVIDTDIHFTGPYLWTEFQSVVPAILSGTVRDRPSGLGIDGAIVEAYDFLNEAVVGVMADPAGAYSLPLYQGDWVVTFDHWEHNGELQRVTLTGDMVLDADLWATMPTGTVIDITMSTWNDADVSSLSVEAEDNRTFRLFFDWNLGDRDQVLDQAEFDAYLALLGFTPPAPPADTSASFLVDGSAYGFVGGSDVFQFLNIPGPIDSTTPPASRLTASYTNPSVPSAWTHTIDMSVNYDQDWETFGYTVTLPPGFVLLGYSAPPEVAVSGVGTGVAVIDPGMDPNPFDPIESVWIRLDVVVVDTTDPTVASASAAPDPSILGQPVTVTALATDDHAVASVRLEVWNATGALVLDVTMTDMGMNTYEHTFTPAGVGTYDFTATATDVAGRTGARSGTFDVIERNPPAIAAASATPDPQGSGLPVLFAATVSDDTAVSSVFVAVRDPSGALIGNYSMALNATSGDWEVAQSFLDVGMLSFTVWATDPFGNVDSAAGTVRIVDQTPPGADAGPTQTVMAGVAVAFDGTGSTDNDRIAGYWWNFTDGGAQSLTGATPSYTFDTPGTYTVTLTVVDPAGNSDTDTVTIVVTPAVGAVEGTVTGTGSAPVAGATVRLMNGTSEVDTTTTDANGDYDFADVPPGDYTVRVTAAGYDAATRDVTVVVGQTATLDVQLTATPTGILGLPSWVWILIVLVVVVAALTFLMWKRRKPAAAPETPPSAPPAPAPPQAPAPPPEAPSAPPEAPSAPPPPPS